MATTILTGTNISGSLTSTGSVGRLNFDGASGHTFIQETADDTLKIFVGGEAKMEFAEDSENIFMQANNYNFRDASFNSSFKLEANNNLFSGSLDSSGSFGHLRVQAKEDGTTIKTDRFGLTIDGQAGYYPLTVQSPYETAARFLSTDGTAAIEIGDNSSTTDYNKIQVVGNSKMEFFVNNQEIIKLGPSGNTTIFNEDSLDINFRFEGGDDTHLFYLDAGKNHATIGANRGNIGDEKLLVAGDVGITGSLHVSGNISTSGSIIAKEFRTEFVNQIIATSSGSTEFGDDTGDVHRFTGSLNISASAGASQLVVGTGNIARYISVSEERALFGYDGTAAVVQGGAGGKHLKLGVNNATLGGNTKFFISSSGNEVGIHTTSPKNGLDVASNTHFGNSISHTHKFTGSLEVSGGIKLPDYGATLAEIALGSGGDGKIYVLSDNLYVGNETSDKDIFIRANDGGSHGTAIQIDASDNRRVKLPNDNQRLAIGASDDIQITHDGSNSYFDNYTGNLNIKNNATDGDIILLSDDGSGGETAYLTLDGSTVRTDFDKPIEINDSAFIADSSILYFGAGNDLRIQHNGSANYIQSYGGPIYIDQIVADEDIVFRNDDGAGSVTTYMRIDGGDERIVVKKSLRSDDNVALAAGTDGDLNLVHNGTDSYVENWNGDLYIRNNSNDKDVILQSDDGSGGVTAYLTLDGSGGYMVANKFLIFTDGQKAEFGSSEDLQIYHDGSNSVISHVGTGDLQIYQNQNDKDIILLSDDGSGGTTAYITLDGSAGITTFSKGTKHLDSIGATFGDSGDLQIFHNGSYGNITNGTGNFYIDNTTDDGDMYFRVDDAGTLFTAMRIDGSAIGNVHLPNDGQSLYLGAGNDLRLLHSGTESYVYNYTGPLYVGAVSTDQDVFIRGNDGGASINAVSFDMSDAGTALFNHDIRLLDNGRYYLGTGNDFQMFHDGSSTSIENLTGDFYITQHANDADMRFRCDDGSGGVTEYIWLDGSASRVLLIQDTALSATKKLYFDGASNTYIHEQSADDLEIVVGGDVLAKFENDTIVLGGGYAVSSSIAFFGQPESPKHMAYGEFTVPDGGDGWHRIARMGTVADGSSNGTRASAKFTVYDTDSSRHSVVTFYASIHFGSNPTIRIINSSDFSGVHGVIEQIRMVHGSTYEGVGVDVYINSEGTSAVRYVMEENYQNNGWTATNFEAVSADPPTGYTMTEISCSYNDGGENNVIDGIASTGLNNTNGKLLSYTLANGNQLTSGSHTVNGTSNFTGVMYIDHGGSDYSPNISFMGGSNTPGSNTYENAGIGYYDNSGTGTMRFFGNRGAMNWEFRDDGDSLFLMASSGDFHANGDVIAASTTTSSDIRLKKNVNDISYGLSEVLQLRGVEFDWKEKRDGKHDIGVIAQEIEKIIPEVVQESKDLNSDTMYKSVDYGKLTAVLVEAVKEQQVQIEELKEDIKELKK